GLPPPLSTALMARLARLREGTSASSARAAQPTRRRRQRAGRLRAAGPCCRGQGSSGRTRTRSDTAISVPGTRTAARYALFTPWRFGAWVYSRPAAFVDQLRGSVEFSSIKYAHQ